MSDVKQSVGMDGLPPLDEPIAWVVVHGHERVGPYSLELLIDEVVAGRLAGTTPVWWPPLADWTTIMADEELAGEIERRRMADAPGWAPMSLAGGPVSPSQPDPTAGSEGSVHDPNGEYATYQTSRPEAVVAVEIVEAEVVDFDVDPESFDDDQEIIDAIITVPSVSPERPNTVFLDLLDRSARLAQRVRAVASVDEAFVSEMVSVGELHGMGFADHHSGTDEHRIHLRDVSGDRELTVLLGRVAPGSFAATPESVIPLSAVMSARGLARSGLVATSTPQPSEQDTSVAVVFDDRSGRTTASVSLFLGVSDYVDQGLAVDSPRLRQDLDSIIEALDKALAD